MNQTRRSSLLESFTQASVGIPIGFTVSFLVGWLRLNPFLQACAIVFAMWIISTIRGYLIRRRFERFASSIHTIDCERRLKDITE
jgi:hypothetical protein